MSNMRPRTGNLRPSPWRGMFVVFSKEARDNTRDHRSLLSALIYPLLGPLLLGLLFSAITDAADPVKRTAGMKLPIVGATSAPALVEYLQGQDIVVVEPPADPEEAVLEGRVPIVLVVMEGFDDTIAAGGQGDISAIYNSSSLPGLVAIARVRDVLSVYNGRIVHERIGSFGIDRSLLSAVQVESVNVSSEKSVVSLLFLMVPALIIFNIFMGGVYLSMDTTSGERERGTLESLLIHPVPRWAILLGKYLAAVLFTVAAVVVQLVAFKLVFAMSGVHGQEFNAVVGWDDALLAVVITLPLMMIAVGVQVIIASVTRTYKEAQTYLGLIPLIPAIPGMVMVFAPIQSQVWMSAVPILSQTLLLGELVGGDPISAIEVAMSAAGSIAVSALMVGFAASLYEKERIIFGG